MLAGVAETEPSRIWFGRGGCVEQHDDGTCAVFGRVRSPVPRRRRTMLPASGGARRRGAVSGSSGAEDGGFAVADGCTASADSTLRPPGRRQPPASVPNRPRPGTAGFAPPPSPALR
jgi:hypothetical protein